MQQSCSMFVKEPISVSSSGTLVVAIVGSTAAGRLYHQPNDEKLSDMALLGVYGLGCKGIWQRIPVRRANVYRISCGEAPSACGQSGTLLAATNDIVGGQRLQAA